ncbi:MAG: hypothetical protein R6U66_00260 [Bacteroidales bacterium]
MQVSESGDLIVLDYEPDSYYELTNSDYETLGYGQYHNFSYIDQAQESIPDLGYSHEYYACKVYNNYLDHYLVYRYDGNVWNRVTSVMEESTVFSYSWNEENYAESYWWKDPNVYIEMTATDFWIIVDYVAENYGTEFIDPRYSNHEIYYGANANFVNFDTREISSEFASWEEAVNAAFVDVYLPSVAQEAVVERYGRQMHYVIDFKTFGGAGTQYWQTKYKVTKAAPDPEFEKVSLEETTM